MKTLQKLIQKNRNWVKKTTNKTPDFFKKLANQQAPDFLWIGCSDSRVPANTIVGMLPGELFVHRNVANQVIQTDMNCLSVIEFAVKLLKVKHVIVCGHYGCGGVISALNNEKNGIVDNWLRNIRDIYLRNKADMDALPSDKEQIDKLCEMNVLHQVRNVCRTTILQDAWAQGHDLTVHGIVYDVADGLVKDLDISVSSNADVQTKVEPFIFKTKNF